MRRISPSTLPEMVTSPSVAVASRTSRVTTPSTSTSSQEAASRNCRVASSMCGTLSLPSITLEGIAPSTGRVQDRETWTSLPSSGLTAERPTTASQRLDDTPRFTAVWNGVILRSTAAYRRAGPMPSRHPRRLPRKCLCGRHLLDGESRLQGSGEGAPGNAHGRTTIPFLPLKWLSRAIPRDGILQRFDAGEPQGRGRGRHASVLLGQ